MTINFKGGQPGLGARDNFDEKSKYKHSVKFADLALLDTWYEKPNYGLLNKSFEPVTVIEDSVNTSLYDFRPYAQEVKALTFVVEAFNRFRDEYTTVIRDLPFGYPKFLESVQPKTGYVNFEERYKEYTKEIINFYAGEVMSNQEIKSFDDFDFYLRGLFAANLEERPISRSGFLLSSHCPVSISGLYIDLANLDYNQDSNKGEILQDEDFLCYAQYAQKYGFMVDKNVPWRLIADLNSEPMKENIRMYHSTLDTEEILSKLFRVKTHYDDIYAIQNIIFRIYDSLIKRSPVGKIIEDDYRTNRSREIFFLRRPLPTTGVVTEYEYWISYLLRVRMLELGMPMEDFDKENRNLLDYHKVYGVKYKRQGKNMLNPVSTKVGRICSTYIKSVYRRHLNINSNVPTRLKDYYNI